jgi:hypothetical protein
MLHLKFATTNAFLDDFAALEFLIKYLFAGVIETLNVV